MRYLDLFTGYGGFTLGIKRAHASNLKQQFFGEKSKAQKRAQGRERAADQHEQELRATNGSAALCIGYSEVNPHAIAVYKKHFPEHQNYGDITKIDPAAIPDFDLLTGGFPCQAFSIAGKRQGFNDTRGTLFFDIARILKVKKPRNFILENVKGLLSHDSGRTFKTIITTLVELGYCVEWQVLNAKDFGVPQNRERVFIVGHFGKIPAQKVFPLKRDEQKDIVADEGIKAGVFPTIRATHYKSGDNQPVIAHTVRTSGRSSGINKKQNWDSYEVDGRIRRLTPRECERLMGLPDFWTTWGKDLKGKRFKMSDTQRYKLCGNGVVVNVVEEVVRRLYAKQSL